VAARVTIGEFSTMTRLTRKALRLYHDAGLLEPVDVDPSSGYRYYDVSQVASAQVIKRLRDLDMPLPDVRSYVTAENDSVRRSVLTQHLDRLESELRRTHDAVSSLRALVNESTTSPSIEMRTDPPIVAVAVSGTVTLSGVADWWNTAHHTLIERLSSAGIEAVGPLGADFDKELFADETGSASLWYPVDAARAARCALDVVTVAGGHFAVALHDGPDARIDETYSALGTHVAEHGIGREGPVRERYPRGVVFEGELVTEIGWPVRDPTAL
jgi:DNA-binding transcriptional MerR regulator/effector-binding domain-containing protein